MNQLQTLFKLCFIFTIFLTNIQCANILFFFQVSTYSHRISAWPLIEKLTERGHNVTFTSIFHPKSPNPKVREYFPKSIQDAVAAAESEKTNILGNFIDVRIKSGPIGTQLLAIGLPNAALKLCEALLKAPETKEFINSETFDLVVIDALFNECGFGFAYKFKAKTIYFQTTHPFAWVHEPFGIIQDTSILPELHVSFKTPMNFFERLFSTIFVTSLYYLKIWFYYPKIDIMFRKAFNDSQMPSIEELEKETNLILMNSHFSEEVARALPPMFIQVGGLHCDWGDSNTKKTPIPNEIAEFIKKSGDDGFIYVSFGSEAKVSMASLEFQNIFYTAFRNSKIHFLWKWEGPRPKEMPSNVLTASWMPQEQILASKNCKGFISHGGLLSIQEAILYAVPMITLPIFAEQDYNSFRLGRTGRGIMLEPSTLTLEQLQHAIAQILTNPMYKENMEEASRLFKDRPQTPLQTAVFWTEYILRHNNTRVLKSSYSMDQYWFQRRLLDVWGFIFISLFFILYINYIIFKKLISFIFCRRSNNSKREKATSTQKVKRS